MRQSMPSARATNSRNAMHAGEPCRLPRIAKFDLPALARSQPTARYQCSFMNTNIAWKASALMPHAPTTFRSQTSGSKYWRIPIRIQSCNLQMRMPGTVRVVQTLLDCATTRSGSNHFRRIRAPCIAVDLPQPRRSSSSRHDHFLGRAAGVNLPRQRSDDTSRLMGRLARR